MRSKFSLFWVGLVLIFSELALSSNKVGNGGNVVQCMNAGKVSLRLLDFYEAEVDPTADGKTAFEIAQIVLKKMSSVAPKLSNQYLKRLSKIESEIDFKNDIQLLEVPDSKHLFKPLAKDCDVVQIAVRKKLVTASEKMFLIRKDLWQQLQPSHQAGLLTHEIIYEHLSKLGEENSIKARRINAFLYAKKSKMNEFWNLIKELEIPIYR